MAKETDLYKILEISKDADEDTIRKAYRKLAKQWHPDKNTDNKEVAEKKFKQIAEAYEILSDAQKKQVYDAGGYDAVKQNGGQGPQVNPFEMFSQMFGGGNIPGMGNMAEMFGGGNNTSENYENVVIPVELTLEELYVGTTLKKTIKRQNICDKCNGYGTKDGLPKVCPHCHGNGTNTALLGGRIQVQVPCNACKKTGIDQSAPKCIKCSGNRKYEETVSISITIPPGSHKKQPITVEEQGNAIAREDQDKIGKKKTDVICVIEEKTHPVFIREFVLGEHMDINYANLLLPLDIPFIESITGFTKKMKHLDGKEFTIKVENCIRHGDILIAKNAGMPNIESPQKYGDMYIKFTVEHPNKLNLTSGIKQRLWQVITGESLKVDNEKYKNILNLISCDVAKEHKKAQQQQQHKQQGRQQFSVQQGNVQECTQQ